MYIYIYNKKKQTWSVGYIASAFFICIGRLHWDYQSF